MNTFGRRIKIARENRGLLQSELAALIGVKSSGVISNWETDKSEPDADKIVKLCHALDVSASYLLDYYGAEDVNGAEYHLLHDFRQLNEEGQQIVLHTVRGLIASNDYTKTVSEDNQVASA